MVEKVLRVLSEAQHPAEVKAFNELVDVSRGNLDELNTTNVKLRSTENLLNEQVAQITKLESELRLARAQQAQSASEVASLHSTVADLQNRLKASGEAGGSKPIVDLVDELRADVAGLFTVPFRASDQPEAPGVVIDGLDFEIRGGLTLGQKVGLSSFAADQHDPAAASVVRFSIRPEMRVRVPDEDQ